MADAPRDTGSPFAGGPVPDDEYRTSALPSTGARVLAFVCILIAGLCGGLIGFAFIELQCEGDCTAQAGAAGVVGAGLFAGGVGIVAVLALRAMNEWRVIEAREQRDG